MLLACSASATRRFSTRCVSSIWIQDAARDRQQQRPPRRPSRRPLPKKRTPKNPRRRVQESPAPKKGAAGEACVLLPWFYAPGKTVAYLEHIQRNSSTLSA